MRDGKAEAKSGASAYIPPAMRAAQVSETDAVSGTTTRRMRGLLNKLTEQTIANVTRPGPEPTPLPYSLPSSLLYLSSDLDPNPRHS